MPRSGVPQYVVAIDMGTTGSAYAFLPKDGTYDNITVKIPKGSRPAVSSTMKTETAALLSDEGKGECMAFGNAALNSRAIAVQDEVQQNGALVRRFKLELRKYKGFHSTNSPMVEAIIGDKRMKVPLAHVMSTSLRHWKDDILAVLSSNSEKQILAEDVSWILTVPAICNDFAKRFMRDAAHKAGMTDKVDSPKLQVCLEPEAACLAVTMGDKTFTREAEGKQIMVINCGGGTVDIITHKIISTSPLRLAEVLEPTGGDWGSAQVDDAFEQWLKSFLGSGLYETLRNRAPDSFFSIMNQWEQGKAEFKGQDSDKLRLDLGPVHKISITADIIEGLRAGYNATRSSDDHVSGKNWMVILPSTLVSTFFAPTIKDIERCFRCLRNSPQLNGLHRVFLVGGFSSCPLVEQTARGVFGDSGCIVEASREPEVAIVKGAVMFASMATVFNSRKAPFTLGVDINRPYDKNDAGHKLRPRRARGSLITGDDGITYIYKCFNPFVVVGEDIPLSVTKNFWPLSANDCELVHSIYASTKKNPRFVDESNCFKLGSVTVALDMSVPLDKRGQRVELKLGGTTLKVVVFNKTKEEEIVEKLITLPKQLHHHLHDCRS